MFINFDFRVIYMISVKSTEDYRIYLKILKHKCVLFQNKLLFVVKILKPYVTVRFILYKIINLPHVHSKSNSIFFSFKNESISTLITNRVNITKQKIKKQHSSFFLYS